MFTQIIHKSTLAALLIILTACQDKPEVIEQIRALKTITVSEVANGQQRRFPGIVRATDSSSLSFEVGGKVQQVLIDIGDHVKKGQLLADLDKEPYKLNLQAVQAELASARSDYKNKQKQFQRVDELEKKGWASKSMWDTALAARDTAKNQINFASSKLNLAKRDLRLTQLTAPFDGSIATRSVDPFMKVIPGQKLFEINADGTMDVEFDIPETIISKIHQGMSIKVNFPTLSGEGSTARISFIGSAAGVANSFPIKADLLDAPATIKPGMSADIHFILRNDKQHDGYLIPLAAILPGDVNTFAYVFIYDPETSKVHKTAIETPKDAAQNNMVQVSKGLSAGDRIAVAGVSFLNDGQHVKLMQH